MAFFKTIEAVRILFMAGTLMLLTSVLLMLSCRCVPSKGVLGGIRRAAWFQPLFRRHCVLWWVFTVALVVHGVFAIGFLGIPF
jgi:hypothetical protein